MTLDGWKTASDIVTAWIGVIALVAGGAFGIYQYLEHEDGERVKETLAFLDRYNRPPLSDARVALHTAWELHSDQQVELLTRAPFSAEAFQEFVLQVVRDSNLSPTIYLVIDFYEALEVCVDRAICEPTVAARFFRADACAFFNQHFAKIEFERSRRNDPELAAQVVTLCRRK